MSDVAQVAVVRRGSVAQYRVNPRGLVDRQLHAIEPNRGFLFSALRFREIADDASGPDEWPGAALASVLARIIFACSIATGGRSRISSG